MTPEDTVTITKLAAGSVTERIDYVLNILSAGVATTLVVDPEGTAEAIALIAVTMENLANTKLALLKCDALASDQVEPR